MEGLQKILKKYHMEKWFQRDNLIILVLAGILLVVIALPAKEQNADPEEVISASEQNIQQSGYAVKGDLEEYESLYAYTAYLEQKLENILADVSGVGKVKVMITLEASKERIVEKDASLNRNTTTENDSAGGSRSIYQSESGEETVYEKDGTEEIPYVKKTILPKISGVLIVAEGAGKGNVTRSITQIAQALFDLEAHKVKVEAMNEK